MSTPDPLNAASAPVTPAQEAVGSIEIEEGWRSAVYDDATGEPIVAGYTVRGNPTIGYGRLVTSAHGITKKEGLVLLANDLANCEGDIESLPAFKHLNLARKAALLDIDFNIGLASLEEFHTFLGYLVQGKYLEAADDLRTTEWFREAGPNPGPGGRGWRVAKIFETGVWIKSV